MKKKDSIECIIYTVLWEVYANQAGIGIEAYAKYLLFPLIAYSLWKVVYVCTHYRLESFMKGLTVFLFLLSIYGFHHLIFGETKIVRDYWYRAEVRPFFYLKYIYCSLPVVYVYYDFARKKVFTQDIIFYYALFLLACAIFSFFSYYSTKGNSNQYIDGVTNNNGYKFVPIMALLFLVKKWRTPLMVVCLCFAVVSIKRGAVMICLLSFLLYLRYNFYSVKGAKRLRVYTVITILLVGIGYGMLSFYESSEGVQRRIDMTLEGNSSGRDKLASKLIDFYINQDNEVGYFIGNGADATIDIAGNYAHNDWLELLINQGAIGVITFLILYIMWYKSWRQIGETGNKMCQYSFGVALMGSFISTIFSMSYTAFSSAISIAIGYCLFKSNYQCTQNNIPKKVLY